MKASKILPLFLVPLVVILAFPAIPASADGAPTYILRAACYSPYEGSQTITVSITFQGQSHFLKCGYLPYSTGNVKASKGAYFYCASNQYCYAYWYVYNTGAGEVGMFVTIAGAVTSGKFFLNTQSNCGSAIIEYQPFPYFGYGTVGAYTQNCS